MFPTGLFVNDFIPYFVPSMIGTPLRLRPRLVGEGLGGPKMTFWDPPQEDPPFGPSDHFSMGFAPRGSTTPGGDPFMGLFYAQF